MEDKHYEIESIVEASHILKDPDNGIDFSFIDVVGHVKFEHLIVVDAFSRPQVLVREELLLVRLHKEVIGHLRVEEPEDIVV